MFLELGPRLSPILTSLSESDLAKLGQRVGVSGKRRKLQTLFERLTDPQYLKPVLEDLGPEIRETLVRWLLLGAVVGPDRLNLMPDFWKAEQALESTGLVYILRSGYYRQAYCIPCDFSVPLWLWLDIGRFASSLASSYRSPRQQEAAGEWFPFLHDVFQVVSFARSEPILLTQQMTVYRRVENRLLQRLWHKSKEERYRIHLVHALQFAQVHGLLGFDNITRTLHVNAPVAKEYWNLNPLNRWGDWFRFASEPNSPFYLRQILCALSAQLEPDQWLDFAALKTWLDSFQIPFSTKSIDVSNLCDRLKNLGIWEGDLSRGRLTDQAYAAWRRRFLPGEKGQSIVQPTGEVLVPFETPYDERWQWDAVTTPVRSDRVSILQIDAPAVEKALDQGIATAEAYLDCVQALVKTEIPGNVAANIRDWFRLLTRHRWMEVTILHSASPSDSQLAEKSLGDFVVSRLSECDLIVRSDEVTQAGEFLKRQGVLLRDKVERPGAPAHFFEEGEDYLYSPENPGLLGFTYAALPQAVPGLFAKSPQEMERVVMEAIHRQKPVTVQYFPYGTDQPMVEQIQPASLNRGWIQGWRVSNRQMISMSLQQITAIGDGSS